MERQQGHTEVGSTNITGKKVSTMRSDEKVIAITTSDWHLRHDPPIARSVESNWYLCMHRAIDEVIKLSNEHEAPIIIAGDIFDRPINSPQLVNFVISELECANFGVYAVPGQHDLLHHTLDNIHKTSFWTLAKAKVLNVLSNKKKQELCDGWMMGGWGWGETVRPTAASGNHCLAVVHDYIWIEGASYKGAHESALLKFFLPKLEGYRTAVFGDNHIGFKWDKYERLKPSITVFNCGTFMRRRIDEIDYKPLIGLLQYNGDVRVHYLNCSLDQFIRKEDSKVLADAELGMKTLMKLLQKPYMTSDIDFRDAVEKFCERYQIGKEVRWVLAEMME